MTRPATRTGSLPGITTIDVARWRGAADDDRVALASELGDACHQAGFFYLVGHGVENALIEQCFSALADFFALPESRKAAMDKTKSPHFRGWERLGTELTGNRVDYREQVDLGPERKALVDPDPYYRRLIGPNQWPDPALAPEFRPAMEHLATSLGEVAALLLEIMSIALGLAPHHLAGVFGGDPQPYLKLIRYPQSPPGGQGVGAHKDSGFLTLLIQDGSGGLEAQDARGNWYAIPPIAGSLVVNVGELMQMLTGNYFLAAPHRVFNHSARARLSMAYFHSPDLDTRLDPLPLSVAIRDRVAASHEHRQAGLMASRHELMDGVAEMGSQTRQRIFGYRYWERWVRSYPEIVSKHYPAD